MFVKINLAESALSLKSASLLVDDPTFHPRICYREFRQKLLPSLPRPIKHCSSFGVDREAEEEMVEATVWKSRNDSSCKLGKLH